MRDRLLTAVVLGVATLLVAGCGGEDSAEQQTSDVASEAPSHAPRKVDAFLADRGSQKADVKCSSAKPVIDGVLRSHPSVDLVAPPDRVCVVRLDGGRTFDFLRINGTWTRLRR
jgi:hypothetical protein